MNKIFLFFIMLMMSACSESYTGDVIKSDRYIYPNSNIMPLGNVSESAEKSDCNYTKEDYMEVYNKALNKIAGTNLLTDYTVEYKASLFKCKLTIRGMANKMEVGKQVIR